jgi:hypothetical protein
LKYIFTEKGRELESVERCVVWLFQKQTPDGIRHRRYLKDILKDTLEGTRGSGSDTRP